jgi:hypothetical protein
MDRSESSHIIVVLATNPAAWARQSQYGIKGLKYDTAVSSIVSFLRAFTLLNSSNKFSLLAAHATKSFYIYPPEKSTPSTTSCKTTTPTSTTSSITTSSTTTSSTTASQKRKRGSDGPIPISDGPFPLILGQLKNLQDRANTQLGAATADNDDDDETECMSLASALSRAMGRANLLRQRSSSLDIRVLVVLASQDYSSYYVPLMNTIFSAEALSVRMDCLNVCGGRSKFMEQAVHQTDGVYQHLDGERGRDRDGILQHLLTHFLVPANSVERTGLQQVLGRSTSASDIDLRATCMWEGDAISNGIVCSVCLSIFSQPAFREMRKKGCATCGPRWKIMTIGKKKKKK